MLDREKLDNVVRFTQDWLDYWFPRQTLPGLSIAIRGPDDFLYTKGYGVADLETGEALTPNHVFRMASHSKMFTAVAAGILHDRGKLDFNDRIGAHLTWLKPNRPVADITIDRLLRHRSKLPRDGVMGGFWNYEFDFPGRETFRDQTVMLRPVRGDLSKSVKYSNWGYGLLGEVIEAASGQGYEDFVQDNVIKPLGLEQTATEYTHLPEICKLAAAHAAPVNGEVGQFNVRADTGALAAATGIYSTPSDMSRFLMGRKKLLKRKTEAAMRANPCKFGPGEMTAGLYSLKEGLLETEGYAGGFPGQVSFSMTCPEKNLTVSIAMNNDVSYPGLISAVFQAAGFYSSRDDDPGASLLEGMYENLREAFYVVAGQKDELLLLNPACADLWDSPSELSKTQDGQYIIRDDSRDLAGEPVRFNHDKRGTVMNVAGISFRKCP